MFDLQCVDDCQPLGMHQKLRDRRKSEIEAGRASRIHRVKMLSVASSTCTTPGETWGEFASFSFSTSPIEHAKHAAGAHVATGLQGNRRDYGI